MTVQEYRKDLHKIPEIGYCEFETKKYILSTLKNCDCKIFQVDETGLIVFFDFGCKETVGIRSDIDALPIKENTGLPFASTHDGVMHACGHDGHMAMVLATALFVDEIKKAGKKLNKNVAFIFQPAEELDGGARHIVSSGILQKLNTVQIFGIHLWPDLEKGKIFSKSGAMLARSGELDITLTGESCHIADSKKGKDTLRAAAELLNTLYRLEESCNKKERCLLKFGKATSGTARNVISDYTELNGSVRALSEDMFVKLKDGINREVKQIEDKFGIKGAVRINEGYPPVINNAKLFDEVCKNCEIEVLPQAVMQAEDFSFYGSVCPSVFFFIGLGEGMKLHNDKFDFDMSLLDLGVNLYKKLLQM